MATHTPADQARHALLALHKSIIDAERDAITQAEGKAPTPNALLQRLVSDPALAWLGALTSLIVRLDEAMEPDATESPAAVVAYAIDLLTIGTPGERTDAFAVGYDRMLQGSPHVVLAHRTAIAALRAT